MDAPTMQPVVAMATLGIDALPESVWQALTTPSKLKMFFFGADVDSTFRVGAPITMRGEMNGKPYEDKGTILIADEPKRLSFSHYSPLSGKPDAPENTNVVTFTLAPENAGTRVTLTQTKLQGPITEADAQNREAYEKNWRGVLEGLRETASSLLV
ncbi:MAG TPA: SRPBCC domain-containing protein [Rhizomicrobium sp.]|jgi:uncharacterized protein YndB with AHSA1/START domain|nr:SRPBCC domain-containing protein [Rhizomicrobium sp.]